MTEFRVSEPEVLAVLSNPLRTEPGGRNHPPGRRVYIGRRIRVVVDSAGSVVTVGPQTDHKYVHGLYTLPVVAAAMTIPHRPIPAAA